MQIRRVDPWSVLKVSAVLSVALFFVWMIAVAFLYLVLGGMGVWSKLNSNVGDLLTSASGSSGGELVSSGTIFGGAALIGLVNIVLLTAMATIGAFIYNLTTDIVGGVEVTLADRLAIIVVPVDSALMPQKSINRRPQRRVNPSQAPRVRGFGRELTIAVVSSLGRTGINGAIAQAVRALR